MPIYEYVCASCGKEFEKLVRQSSPAPECPDCHSKDFINRVAGPIANKMFECGMIP